MRGFVSTFFLMLLIPTLMEMGALDHFSFFHAQPNGIPEVLGLARLEMENATDEIIREELYLGLLQHQPGEKIKETINAHLISFLEEWKTTHNTGISIEMGFVTQEQTEYLTLLHGEMKPLAHETLNENTHILILPIDEENTYGEFTYTAGPHATSILVTRLRAGNHETLFALPRGHRTCASTLIPTLPCVE